MNTAIALLKLFLATAMTLAVSVALFTLCVVW